MEKETLIEIILNDLKEVSTLITTFKGKNEINNAFINLTRTKITNISEEFSLLEQLNIKREEKKPSEPKITSNTPSDTEEDNLEAIAESSESIISEEAEATVKAPIKSKETKEPKKETPEVKADDNAIPPVEETPQPVADKTETKQIEPEEPKAEKTSAEEIIKKHSTGKTTVLGEQIKKESQSVNEIIATKKDSTEDIKQIGKPVNDVKKAFGLNDRFYYQRELFNGDSDFFNQTLDAINQLNSYEDAINFLKTKFNWEQDSEVSESFYKNIKRRFI